MTDNVKVEVQKPQATCLRSPSEQRAGPRPHVLPCPTPHSTATALALAELRGHGERLPQTTQQRGGRTWSPGPETPRGGEGYSSYLNRSVHWEVHGHGLWGSGGAGEEGQDPWLWVVGDGGNQASETKDGRTGRSSCPRLGLGRE